jgi:predicted component of type VI protein secretion system
MVLEYIDDSYSQGGFYFFDENGGSIGTSSSKNKIILKDANLEDSHCAIVQTKGCFYIKDLGTSAGTFLRVRTNVALQNGLFFNLGKTSFGVTKIILKVYFK